MNLFLSQMYCVMRMHSKDYLIRYDVAKHIDISYLPQMMYDESRIVRIMVARRIDKKNALLMNALDEDESVRETAWNNVMGLS
jgi:hypothetical protein